MCRKVIHMIVIDGSGLVLGRLATNVAKRLLNGEKVEIINAEKVVMTGRKEFILKKIKGRLDLTAKGNPYKGPKYSALPNSVVRRAVRGMLFCRKRQTARDAYRNLKAHIGIPEELKDAKAETVENARSKPEAKVVKLEEVCWLAGARW